MAIVICAAKSCRNVHLIFHQIPGGSQEFGLKLSCDSRENLLVEVEIHHSFIPREYWHEELINLGQVLHVHAPQPAQLRREIL